MTERSARHGPRATPREVADAVASALFLGYSAPMPGGNSRYSDITAAHEARLLGVPALATSLSGAAASPVGETVFEAVSGSASVARYADLGAYGPRIRPKFRDHPGACPSGPLQRPRPRRGDPACARAGVPGGALRGSGPRRDGAGGAQGSRGNFAHGERGSEERRRVLAAGFAGDNQPGWPPALGRASRAHRHRDSHRRRGLPARPRARQRITEPPRTSGAAQVNPFWLSDRRVR